MKAIIVAGGFGTRLRPLTDNTPKPMLPVNGVPILALHVKRLVKAGIKDIIISTGYLDHVIKDYFGDGADFGAHISYSHEDSPLGTGGAVVQANGENEFPFLLIWGDNVHDVDFQAVIEGYTSDILMVLTQREDVEHFGVAKLNGDAIEFFVEKPAPKDAPSTWINAGVYIVDPKYLSMLPPSPSNIDKDLFMKLSELGHLHAFFHTGQWYPTDTKEKYELAQNFKEKS